MKKKLLAVLAVLLCLSGICACGNEETDAVNNGGYASRLISLGNYKGISYTDNGTKEPSEEDVEQEMTAILSWFEGAEMTDDSVKEYLDFNSVEEFREDTYQNLKEVYEKERRKSIAKELIDTVIEASEFEIKQQDVDLEYEKYLKSYETSAKESGLSFEEYATEVLEIEAEDLKTGCLDAAKEVVRASLVVDGILNAEGLDADASYEKIGTRIAQDNGLRSLEEFEEAVGGKAEVQREVKYQIAADFLMENGIPQQ